MTSLYSHKHNGPGLRYVLAASVETGYIVWVHGPYPCGSHPDVCIFRIMLKGMLSDNEKIIADRGYRDIKCTYTALSDPTLARNFSLCRARHEAVNRRIKQFNVLRQRFRHCKSRNGICFHAVSNMTQIMIEQGAPFFPVTSE